MENKQTAWNRRSLEDYLHDYLSYLVALEVITKAIAKMVEEKREDLIKNALERNLSAQNYPFILILRPKLYCIIDVDTGFDLMQKTAAEAAKITESRNRRLLNQREVEALEKARAMRMMLSEKKESPEITLSMQTLFKSRGSYAEVIEL